MEVVLVSLVLLGGVGLLCGIALAIAARVFAVKLDPRMEAIEKALPGANCGGCGFPSCHAYAQNMVDGAAEPNRCVLCDAEAVGNISKILGKSAAAIEKKIAAVKCCGASTAAKSFDYGGIPSCRAASLYGGGDKLCSYSCLGFGDCVKACPFGALSRSGRGAPIINRDRCTGCGNCVAVCPKNVIVLIPREASIHIACNSKDKGKDVREVCDVGCISCSRCIKTCPENALSMQDNRICIDYSKCTRCGLCTDACPRTTIKDIHPREEASRAANQ